MKIKSKQKSSYKIAKETGFIGSFTAESDLSVNYKKKITKIIDKKIIMVDSRF